MTSSPDIAPLTEMERGYLESRASGNTAPAAMLQDRSPEAAAGLERKLSAIPTLPSGTTSRIQDTFELLLFPKDALSADEAAVTINRFLGSFISNRNQLRNHDINALRESDERGMARANFSATSYAPSGLKLSEDLPLDVYKLATEVKEGHKTPAEATAAVKDLVKQDLAKLPQSEFTR